MRLRHLQLCRAAAAGVDHGSRLPPSQAEMRDSRRGKSVVDEDLVWIDGALHHVLAEPVDRGDEHHVAEPRPGVEREHDAARARSARTIFITPTERPTLK